jgi:glutamate/tyrosine decarboxylase-like PLP-dependent enzyme
VDTNAIHSSCLEVRKASKFAGRIEGSMSSQGAMATWATIQLLGKEGITSLLDHTLDLTEHAYKRTRDSRILRPIHKPETNTLLIGVRSELPDHQYEKMIQTVQTRADEAHGYYISHNGEVDDGRSAFRFVAMHPHSTTQNVDELIDILECETRNYLNES